jgi:hypothetical protein
MDHFRIICEDLGVPLAEEKNNWFFVYFDISRIGNRHFGNGNSNTTMQIVGSKRKIGICT